MTMEVSAIYKERWSDKLKLRLQSRGNMLSGTVSPPIQIDANKFYFLRTGKLNASKWAGRGHAVVRQGSDEDRLEIESSEWDCPYELYDRDKWLTAAGEEQARQEQAANALGRTADQIIYDEIMAADIPNENIIGDYSSGLTPYMLLEAETRLFEQFTPNDGKIYAPLAPRQYERLSTFKISASSDWIGGDLPLTKMTKVRSYGNLNCFMMEQDLVARYTTTVAGAKQLRCRFWHKECVGAGYVGQQLRVEWKREGDYKRWLVIHTLDGAAKVIEPNGIVELRLKADAPIEPEVLLTRAAA